MLLSGDIANLQFPVNTNTNVFGDPNGVYTYYSSLQVLGVPQNIVLNNKVVQSWRLLLPFQCVGRRLLFLKMVKIISIIAISKPICLKKHWFTCPLN